MLAPDEVRAAHGSMVPTPFRVAKRRRETADTCTLSLTPAQRDVPIAFAPGQFNMIYVMGKGESAISISGDKAKPGTLVHTVRAVGKVTRAFCAMKAGDTLGVRGPFGTGWPVEEARGKDVLIVAGGIGLAPLRPAIYHILANRGDYQRVTLLYGARTPEDVLYMRELGKWRGRFDFSVHMTVDSARQDWRGHVGIVTRLIKSAEFDDKNTLAMVCGPEIMMRLTAIDLVDRWIPAKRIYVSMERNMKCAMGFCGHCQFGPEFVCKDGPVFPFSSVEEALKIREL
jgi:NAD(P)H-flavin reductase